VKTFKITINVEVDALDEERAWEIANEVRAAMESPTFRYRLNYVELDKLEEV
jgi:hypothetical protein